MAVIPTLETGKLAQVAHQVKQEEFEQQRIQLAQRQQAIQAFNNQVNSNMQRLGMQQRQEAAERQAGFKATELAVNLGIKYEPGTRSMRPLKPEDPEFAPWKERQAERKAKRPLTLEQRFQLEQRKAGLDIGKAVAIERGKRVVREPFEIAGEKRALADFGMKLKAQEDRDIRDEERTLGRELKEEERENVRWRARQKTLQTDRLAARKFSEELDRETEANRPTDTTKNKTAAIRLRMTAQSALRSVLNARDNASLKYRRDNYAREDNVPLPDEQQPVHIREGLYALEDSFLTDIIAARKTLDEVNGLESKVITGGADRPRGAGTPVPIVPGAAPGGAVVAPDEAPVGETPQPVGPTATTRPLGRAPTAGEPLVKKPLVPLAPRRVMIVGNQKYLIPQEPKARTEFLGRIDTLLRKKAVLEKALPREKDPLEARKLRREISDLRLEIESVVVDNFTPVSG